MRVFNVPASSHRAGVPPLQSALVALILCFSFVLSVAHAQEALPTPSPTPLKNPPVTITPTATALPSKTPGVAATPSPASLPSVVPPAPTKIEPSPSEPVRGFGDPNRVIVPPPVLATPTPEPVSTTAPAPVPTPIPDGTGGTGDVTGQEPPGGDFSLEAPGGVIYDGERGLALAQGAVTFRYRDFIVRGDRGVVDYNTNNATLSGNLTVTAQANGQSQTFTGQSIVFNLDTGKWILSQLKTTFPPEFFPPGTVLAPLYQNDGTVTGQGDNVRGENFRFSSCDRDHYYLRSNRIDFYRLPSGQPQRIVLRKNALFLLGRKILPLPVYSISLLGQRSRRQPLQTTFGQNTYDGFFAKTIYDLRANSKLTDSFLIDALSKRGLGLGFQRELVGGGLLYLYAVSGKTGGREINGRVNKHYQISKLVSSNISFQSTQNNSLAGSGISSRSGNFSLSRSGARAQTNATYSFDSSSYTGSSSRTDSLYVQHQQQLGIGLNLSVQGDLNQSQFGDSTSSSTPQNQTGDLNVQVGQTGRAFDLYLRSELHNDFARGNAAFQLERLPELLIQSDTQRLKLGFINQVVPGNFTFGVGTFNEPSSSFSDQVGGQKSRADFFYNFNERQIQLVGNQRNGSVFRTSGTFEQAFYSDDTARYNYAYNFNNTSSLGPIEVAINYNKQRTFGFTPFQFDYLTPGEYVDYTASVGRGDNFRLNFSGGRDIQNDYTRDVLANLQWIPSQGTYVSLGTSYGLQAEQRGLFGDIYGNIRFSRRQTRTLGGQFALGFRYTPSGTGTVHGLTRVNASFDTNLTRKVRFQALAGYDGISNRFDFQQYRAIFDLHCFNLFTTYDGSRKELRFDLALKAFPFADTRFGRNGLSEGFDPGVGEVR
ncbi:hypothetical protein IAD21_03041 [Abditibacteriota bacterium]|nr:hypothetical protein IAD21_03041 [Abditibacteriota bacterium]